VTGYARRLTNITQIIIHSKQIGTAALWRQKHAYLSSRLGREWGQKSASRAHVARFNNSWAAKSKLRHSRPAAPVPICRPTVGSKSISDIGRCDLKQCPRCDTTMLLDQIMAKFGPLPETRRYRCPECHCVVEEEIDRNGHPLSAIKFAGLPDWLGTRRVVN
jgi:hypothetical protein